jgi:hypothetical protein
VPRAFDQRQLNVDRNPLINFVDLPSLPTINPDDLFASLLNACSNPFVTGLTQLGTGTNNLIKLDTGIQSFIDTLFGLLVCNLNGNLTPQAMLESLGDLLDPIINNAFVQGLVDFAEFLGRETGTFIGDIFAGATGLADWFCGILTCNPEAVGTTPQSIIDGVQAVLEPILANPFIQGIIAWADEVGVSVGNFALDLYNGILAMVEALCSLVTTGALPTTYGSWSNTPAQIITDLTALVTTLLNNPIIDGLRDLITGTGNVLYDTITGLSEFVTELVGLLGEFVSGPAAIIDFFSTIFGEEGFVGWLTSLPFIGPLVAKLTNTDSSGDIALDLATLGNWAQNLLTNSSSIPAANLFGSLPEAIFATLPVSSINFSAGNLLAQGNFNNAQTVDASGGWVWDGNTTATGSGGSVKATATGSAQQLYSRQTIKIASGDRVDVSAMVKTSGFTSGSMVLSVIPWIGTTAQTAQVIHTRTTSASNFTAMTGSRLRFGGTAEAGEVLLSGSITALTVRLAVTANAGAQVWFDDVSVKKSGALAQTLVEYLTTTWEQAWNAVFTSGGAGKQWFDFVTTVSTVFTRANLGVTKGDGAQGTAIGIIDGVGQAVFGDAAYASLPQTTKQSIRKLVGTLFGVSNPVLNDLIGDVIPNLDGSIITGGTVDSAYLDATGIGETINPTAGSGAQISRRTITNQQASPGDVKVVAGFYDHIDFAPSADIQILNSSNAVVTGTGTKSNLAGIFKVTQTGWYLVELCIRLNPSWSGGGKVAPLLWRSTNYPTTAMSKYKMGVDGVYVPVGFGAVGPRFVQSSFIVYLPAGGAVQAGYNAEGTGLDVLDADSNGTETYFTISLLNKTYI